MPTQDSVIGSGTGVDVINRYNFTIDVRSGPSGENATGRLTVTFDGGVAFDGRVSCLAVRGNVATMNFPVFSPPGSAVITNEVTDGGATGTRRT